MSQDEVRVIVCRAVRDGLTEGLLLGYECEMCKEPLQVTTWAAEMIPHHKTMLLCNECGLLYVTIAKESVAGYKIGPEAQTQLDKGNSSRLASWIRRNAR